MKNPTTAPSTINPAPAVIRVNVPYGGRSLGELGELVTVIWTFLPLVKASLGDEMLYDP